MQRLGGSSVKRWSKCHWSVNGAIDIETSGEAAELGTEVHAQLETYLRGEAETFPEQGLAYVEFCSSNMINDTPYYEPFYIECKVQHPDIEFMSGTADFISDQLDEVKVADYKNGMVPVTDFAQQLYYGALYQLQAYGCIEKAVSCFTFQPNSLDYVRTRSKFFTKDEVEEFLKRIEDAALRIRDGSDYSEVGEHCRYCKAASNCRHILDFIEESMKYPSIAACLDVIPIVEGWVKTIEEQAFAALKQGHGVGAYTIAPTRPSGVWKEGAFSTLSEMSPEVLTLKPIGQVEKILGKKFVAPFVEKVSKGEKIVKLELGDLQNVESD